MKRTNPFIIVKNRLDGREGEDELILISIEETEKYMFDFVVWCDENCCFINPETSLWESQLLNIKNYSIEDLYFLFETDT